MGFLTVLDANRPEDRPHHVYINGRKAERVLRVVKLGPFGFVKQARTWFNGDPILLGDEVATRYRFGLIRIEPIREPAVIGHTITLDENKNVVGSEPVFSVLSNRFALTDKERP